LIAGAPRVCLNFINTDPEGPLRIEAAERMQEPVGTLATDRRSGDDYRRLHGSSHFKSDKSKPQTRGYNDRSHATTVILLPSFAASDRTHLTVQRNLKS
jgi:hypothetical protein